MPPQNLAYSLSEGDALAGAASARSQPAKDELARTAHLRRQQLELLALQATRSPFAIFIAVGFVTYIVWDQVPLLLVVLWAGALAAVLFTRMAYALRLLRSEPVDAQPALNRMTWFAFANGAVTGASMPLFFHALTFEGQALLTMVLVCWSAGGVSTAAAYARAFYAFVGPTLLPAAAVWAMTVTPQHAVLAVLILMFGLIQIFFVRDNERVVRRSFSIRYDNERLMKALEAERQDAAHLIVDRLLVERRGHARAIGNCDAPITVTLEVILQKPADLGVIVDDQKACSCRWRLRDGMTVPAPLDGCQARVDRKKELESRSAVGKMVHLELSTVLSRHAPTQAEAQAHAPLVRFGGEAWCEDSVAVGFRDSHASVADGHGDLVALQAGRNHDPVPFVGTALDGFGRIGEHVDQRLRDTARERGDRWDRLGSLHETGPVSDLIEHHRTGVVDESVDVDELCQFVIGPGERSDATGDVLDSVRSLVAIAEHVGDVIEHFFQIRIGHDLLERLGRDRFLRRQVDFQRANEPKDHLV